MAGRRAGAGQQADRINAAAELAEAGVAAAEAARVLAGRFGCSVRQARRYVDQAAASGRVAVPEPGVVFTVTLPAALVVRVRAPAREAGVTISALVAQALEVFVARGPRNHPRG